MLWAFRENMYFKSIPKRFSQDKTLPPTNEAADDR